MGHNLPMAAQPGGPYREPPAPPQATPRSDGAILRDAFVVICLFAAISSIARWGDAVTAVSEAMGFPRLR